MLHILRRIQPLKTQAEHDILRNLRTDKRKPIYAFTLPHDLSNDVRAYFLMGIQETRLRSLTYDGKNTIFWLLDPDANEAFNINSSGTIIWE